METLSIFAKIFSTESESVKKLKEAPTLDTFRTAVLNLLKPSQTSDEKSGKGKKKTAREEEKTNKLVIASAVKIAKVSKCSTIMLQGDTFKNLEGKLPKKTGRTYKECDIDTLNKKFGDVHLLFDAYSKFGVKSSKIKNPVNQMNAVVKYGIDNPEEFLLLNKKLEYVATHLIKKDDNNLPVFTKVIFNNLYCGRISQSIYKIYEFNLKK